MQQIMEKKILSMNIMKHNGLHTDYVLLSDPVTTEIRIIWLLLCSLSVHLHLLCTAKNTLYFRLKIYMNRIYLLLIKVIYYLFNKKIYFAYRIFLNKTFIHFDFTMHKIQTMPYQHY